MARLMGLDTCEAKDLRSRASTMMRKLLDQVKKRTNSSGSGEFASMTIFIMG